MTNIEIISLLNEKIKESEEFGEAALKKTELRLLKTMALQTTRTAPVHCVVKYGAYEKRGEFCLCGKCYRAGKHVFVSYGGNRDNYCRECGAEVIWNE